MSAAQNQDPIVIVGLSRTPMGGFQGDFTPLTASELGAVAVKGALTQSGLSPDDIDEAVMGCVLPAGQGQAPARQAILGAGLPQSVGCTTVNKMCGSGMQAAMMAHDSLMAGSADVMIAGGMESMTNAPYLLAKMRGGARLGHTDVKDSMFLDGLEDAYDKGKLMGVFAEQTAQHYQFTREEQDAYAISSLERANAAINGGHFKSEISPVTVTSRKGDTVIDTDEQPGKARTDKIPTLRPAFAKDGTVTAANASSISDGAAALVMMKQSQAEKRGLTPVAKIVGHSTHAQAPEWFSTAPIGALKKLYEKTGWTDADVDLYEINEAFAVVTMAAMRDLGLDHAKVNVHGGACALGHPIGASGARILVTLIAALQTYGKKRGMATLCIGGGEATAMAVELM
ncbi:acetyl-CoA C-acyltransferase [Paremcibacter congregatus]|uniref:Acetyl-CoA C-acyltransferase n=1 Tax=Paremcibacter congregatus TaxID=2043170 RepID=A0A2G4YTY9_9PROT|nr:acetyl-CoA C-acyltransferase [Paremcibacter congregatus]PHZ85809.1 acetyl-CoA C-acyltransferase [Paremcibacter congregatus]QDE26772.1 acetyl-CoA C-acyltransferase [Paremcibacter congregatus]